MKGFSINKFKKKAYATVFPKAIWTSSFVHFSSMGVSNEKQTLEIGSDINRVIEVIIFE